MRIYKKLPDYREKQKILYSEGCADEVMIACGDRFRKENRTFDALEFYKKAKHRQGLEEIMEAAASFGDAMIFEQTAWALGREPTGEEWSRLGHQAFSLKKYSFARYAFEKCYDSFMLEDITRIQAEENKG